MPICLRQAQMSQDNQLDSIVLAVINKFKARAAFGKEKYGTDLDRKDLKPLDWIQHSQEELMDGILYLEKLKQELSEVSLKEANVASKNTTHLSQTLSELKNP